MKAQCVKTHGIQGKQPKDGTFQLQMILKYQRDFKQMTAVNLTTLEKQEQAKSQIGTRKETIKMGWS